MTVRDGPHGAQVQGRHTDSATREMYGLRSTVVFAAFCVGPFSAAQGQGRNMTVSADPAPVVVATAVAGLAPDPVLENSTTYGISTTGGTTRILARLNAALPPGVVLELTLEAPPGATSVGPVALTTADQDVVVGIPSHTDAAGLRITYTLAATPAAGPVASRAVAVILTAIRP